MKKSEDQKDVLTIAAEAIGSTIGKIAVRTGLAAPNAMPAATPAKRAAPRKEAVNGARKRKAPKKKAAPVRAGSGKAKVKSKGKASK